MRGLWGPGKSPKADASALLAMHAGVPSPVGTAVVAPVEKWFCAEDGAEGGAVTPYFTDSTGRIVIYLGDCREIMMQLSRVDVVITDPPYGETSLAWDAPVDGWADRVPAENFWCFGSLHFFMRNGVYEFVGWKFAQDIVWEKHNGSVFHADRFRRVHEHVVQFYRGDWADIYKSPVKTMDATARTVRAKARPPHTGHIERVPYESIDGGPRLQRSVIKVRSCHGYAIHPTQKPTGIIAPLVEYSCPPDGTVLDPFMGSGSTLEAARLLGRKAIGIEIREEYADAAANRLRQEVLPL